MARVLKKNKVTLQWIDTLVKLMGNFNRGPISRNDIVSSFIPEFTIRTLNPRLFKSTILTTHFGRHCL